MPTYLGRCNGVSVDDSQGVVPAETVSVTIIVRWRSRRSLPCISVKNEDWIYLHDPIIQACRRACLLVLINELDAEGIHSWRALGKILGGLSGNDLKALVTGDPISNEIAREMEWTMHKPVGWMDGGHATVLDN
ncbi:hypothetical protein L2Y96_12570 [Luteibacter aegosomaticola]|uniref:hypothetical protein n=1 Tax=Luteibacter aegosomaticola TaxID=2911538 RepID=UPI001FF762FF|nr:hypothetical protein [Luteibacter aegosomaticola]UPG88253.1 hypothetical protein L2Y96_12570 [Luteibacter aegosomaticola]